MANRQQPKTVVILYYVGWTIYIPIELSPNSTNQKDRKICIVEAFLLYTAFSYYAICNLILLKKSSETSIHTAEGYVML